MMRILLAAFMFFGAASGLWAECYADYKAKQANPLKLHYGVMRLVGCDPKSAQSDVKKRLGQNGWQLVGILNIFGAEGLKSRKSAARDYYLRY